MTKLTGAAYLDDAKKRLAAAKSGQASIAASRGAASAPVKATTGTGWVWPTSSRTISQGVSQGHMAIDISGSRGAPVVAPTAGRVSGIKYQERGYGYNVRLTTPEGLTVILGHLQAVAEGLAIGRQVEAGETLGLLGSTGRSTGPHLHFEIRQPGYEVDRFVQGTSAGIGAIDPRPFLSGTAVVAAERSSGRFTFAPQTQSSVGLTSSTFAQASTGTGKAPVGKAGILSGVSAAPVGKASVNATAQAPKGSITVATTPVGKISIPAPGANAMKFGLIGLGVVIILIGLAMLAKAGASRGAAAAGEVLKRGPGLVPVKPKAVISRVSAATGVG